MLSMCSNSAAVVGRVRLCVSQGEGRRYDLRVKGMLERVHFQPSSLPASAVLCIRCLRDPKPGSIPLRYGASAPAGWVKAVSAAIDEMGVRACRPLDGLVPANSEAVLFLDKSELLACLASDWSDGVAASRWWWKSLFRTMDVSRAVLRAWLEAPEYVPAALEHLAEQRTIVPFIQRLSLVESKKLLNSIIHRFALYAVEPEIGVFLASGGDDIGVMGSATDRSPKAGSEAGKYPEKPFEFTRAEEPPWYAWVPEGGGKGLDFVQQCLVGIGLMLTRAPAVARLDSFARAVGEWLSARVLDRDRTREFSTLTPSVPRLPVTRETAREKVSVTQRSRSQEGISQGASDQGLGDMHSKGGKSLLPEPLEAPLVSDEQAGSNIEKPAKADSTTEESPSFANAVPEEGLTDVASAGPLFEETIDSDYGGVFYLINLGIFLGLYGDFTAPRNPGIALSIWDFVALVGKQIVGEEIKSDSVWSLLSRLAVRNQGQEPGEDFIPPEQWRLPVEWLGAFPEGSIWKWNAHGGRLMVKHHDGFPVLDLEAEEDPTAQVKKATEDYRTLGAFELSRDRSAGFVEHDSALDRWKGWIMPYIQARLVKALGLRKSDDITKVLFKSHAQVAVTLTHLGVFFSLSELPIEVRLSGLDRNPGWVPAAGRYVEFHFT